MVKFFSSNCEILLPQAVMEIFEEEEEDIFNRYQQLALIPVVGSLDQYQLTKKINERI